MIRDLTSPGLDGIDIEVNRLVGIYCRFIGSHLQV